MAKLRQFFTYILLLATVVAVVWGGILAVNSFFTAVSELSPQVRAAVVGGLATALVGIFGTILNQRSLKKRDIREAQRPQKIQAYEALMSDVIIPTLRQTSEGGELSDDFLEDLREVFFDFTGDAIFWASPQFIAAYKKFRAAGQEESQEVILYLDEMLQAIRKDLGHRDWTLQQGDLMKLFLIDPESLEELRRSS